MNWSLLSNSLQLSKLYLKILEKSDGLFLNHSDCLDMCTQEDTSNNFSIKKKMCPID